MSGPDRACESRVPLVGLRPDALVRAFGRRPWAAILESGPGFGPDAGRWSVFAAEPLATFAGGVGGWEVEVAPDRWRDLPPDRIWAECQPDGDILGRLEATLQGLGLGGTEDAPPAEGPPFTGGLLGFLSYDLAPRIERLPRRVPDIGIIPPFGFGLYDRIVLFDHLSADCVAILTDFSGTLPREARDRRADAWASEVAAVAEASAPIGRCTGAVRPIVSRAEYEASVARALDYIAAGDVFQVNLSQRFEAGWEGDPLALYERLRAVSPSPFGAFLRWPGFAVVSASPECFYTTRGDRIVTRPIKGTRPRGSMPADDRRLRDELASSAKDRAELTMIVDLERNDLGRVCRYGSVRVVESHRIESYAQVHHQVATVEGRLRADAGPVDVIRAMFPGGSITGAPKIRAMQIIDELEPVRRGIYTGAVGYFGRNTSGFNIAIRTAVVAGGRVSYSTGGGIVADSVPALEYEETLHKGRGLRQAIEGPAR